MSMMNCGLLDAVNVEVCRLCFFVESYGFQ